ncbi:MAG TPA: DinB family protein [Edaphobacter sp.]|nr:DinB family protein [Edaphobacter sp.]
MSPLALTAEEVLAWHEKNTAYWRQLLTDHPEALAIPCDIAGTKSAGELLQHIVAVELRYAERLAGLPATDYAAIPFDSVASIYATHGRSATLFRNLLATTEIEWNERIEFVTRSMGPARASRKAIFFHALLHGERHYAQLATLLRQHGIKPGWPMDYLFTDMEKV